MIKLYTVLDTESQTTNNPFTAPTHRDAVEGLKNVANDPQTTIHKHPEDFVLYYMGEYDLRAMKFDILKHPEKITTAKELLQ